MLGFNRKKEGKGKEKEKEKDPETVYAELYLEKIKQFTARDAKIYSDLAKKSLLPESNSILESELFRRDDSSIKEKLDFINEVITHIRTNGTEGNLASYFFRHGTMWANVISAILSNSKKILGHEPSFIAAWMLFRSEIIAILESHRHIIKPKDFSAIQPSLLISACSKFLGQIILLNYVDYVYVLHQFIFLVKKCMTHSDHYTHVDIAMGVIIGGVLAHALNLEKNLDEHLPLSTNMRTTEKFFISYMGKVLVSTDFFKFEFNAENYTDRQEQKNLDHLIHHLEQHKKTVEPPLRNEYEDKLIEKMWSFILSEEKEEDKHYLLSSESSYSFLSPAPLPSMYSSSAPSSFFLPQFSSAPDSATPRAHTERRLPPLLPIPRLPLPLPPCSESADSKPPKIRRSLPQFDFTKLNISSSSSPKTSPTNDNSSPTKQNTPPSKQNTPTPKPDNDLSSPRGDKKANTPRQKKE